VIFSLKTEGFSLYKKILIANRGEIAVRLIRACSELNITSVAIYSDADRHALHVKKADESYNIGADPLAGYLNAHNIVNIAVTSGCDAIHPGYGFLSENPELAEICARRDIKFIGPNADIIRQMGDKIQARTAMIAASIPVIPGSEGNIESLDEAKNLPPLLATLSCLKQLMVVVGEVLGVVIMKKNSSRITIESFLKQQRPLVSLRFLLKNVSYRLSILKFKFWPTASAMLFIFLKGIAPFKDEIRSSLK